MEAVFEGNVLRLTGTGEPGSDLNRKLRLDAIRCTSGECGYTRLVRWGTPEQPAEFSALVALHMLDHPNHEMSYPHDVRAGMQLATDEEIALGKMYLRGFRDGQLDAAHAVDRLAGELKKQVGL